MNPFRMCGRIIEVYHFQVDYIENEHPEIRYFPTKEEADYIAKKTGGTVKPTDATSVEWMDGIEVDDVPDPYGEAVKIYEMGEAEYKKQLSEPDVNDILFDMAYKIALLELGIN